MSLVPGTLGFDFSLEPGIGRLGSRSVTYVPGIVSFNLELSVCCLELSVWSLKLSIGCLDSFAGSPGGRETDAEDFCVLGQFIDPDFLRFGPN